MNTIHGRNLPEQVLRYIFRYIGTEELRFTVRKLNKSFQKYIDDYLQCQGVFVLTGGQNETTTLIHIFKREGKHLETVSVVPMSLLKREHKPHLRNYPYDFELYSLSASLTDMEVPLFMEVCFSAVPDQKSLLCDVTTFIYQFDLAKYAWKLLKARYLRVTGEVIACCPISDSSLIMVIDSYEKSGWIGMEDLSTTKLQLIHVNMHSVTTSGNNILPVLSGYDQTIWDTPEPIYTMDGKALIGVAKNTIILITPELLWLGTLTTDQKTIVWESNNMGQMVKRRNPYCFKLKDNVYIFGDCEQCCVHKDPPGLISTSLRITLNKCCYFNCNGCDKYNYKERKFYPNVHSMPYILTRFATASLPFVATDKNETFAVFLFGAADKTDKMDKIYIFTEIEGFVEAKGNHGNAENMAKLTIPIKTSWSNGSVMAWVGN